MEVTIGNSKVKNIEKYLLTNEEQLLIVKHRLSNLTMTTKTNEKTPVQLSAFIVDANDEIDSENDHKGVVITFQNKCNEKSEMICLNDEECKKLQYFLRTQWDYKNKIKMLERLAKGGINEERVPCSNSRE